MKSDCRHTQEPAADQPVFAERLETLNWPTRGSITLFLRSTGPVDYAGLPPNPDYSLRNIFERSKAGLAEAIADLQARSAYARPVLARP